MKYTASILAFTLAHVNAGTNKTLAPTPGVIRPTPFPTGFTGEPTYVLVDDDMSMDYILESFGKLLTNASPNRGTDELSSRAHATYK